jgi:microcystin-dependent protein
MSGGCSCGNGSEGCSDRLNNINMPTGHDGLPGGDGTDGLDGKGYDASTANAITILDTADTTIDIVIDLNKAYTPGARVRVSKVSAPTTDYFEGICTAYNYITGELSLEAIDLKEGTGSSSAWNVNLAGEPGLDGEQGEKGETGDTTIFIDELENNQTLLNELKALLLPIGSIITWSGDPTTCFDEDGTGLNVGGYDLTGWGLCDETLGNDGTGWYKATKTILGKIQIPPLKGRFIVGYDPAEPDYDTIGNPSGVLEHVLDSDNIPLHDHSVGVTINNTNSAHTHGLPEITGAGSSTSGWELNPGTELTQKYTGFPATNGENLDGLHVHTATVAESEYGKASPDALDNRPPYYVLAYIIKIDA